MKILIIEDDPLIQRSLRLLLAPLYSIETAATLSDSRYRLEDIQASCILLDRNLPDGDGAELLPSIRALDNHPRVLVLTARTSRDEIASIISAGADDYLIKPYHPNELLARISSLLARVTEPKVHQFSEADLLVDYDRCHFEINGREQQIRKREWQILCYLCRHVSRPCTQEELIEHIWESEQEPFSNSVAVHISRLRKMLDTNNSVFTIFGQKRIGYRLVKPS